MTEDPTPHDARNTPRPDPELDFLQARILGVLVEKRLTVPDTYPLTLNALVAGCNQKTSRDPVIETTESEVRDALDGLRRDGVTRAALRAHLAYARDNALGVARVLAEALTSVDDD